MIEIKYVVDLVLLLYDTVTGFMLRTSQFFCYKYGKQIKTIPKDNGYLVFTEIGRENCTITIESNTYFKRDVEIDFSKLDKRLPLLLLQLVPKDKKSDQDNMYVLSGKLPGMESLEGIRKGAFNTRLRSFDERKRLLTITSPYRVEFKYQYYARLCGEFYEPFQIIKQTESSVYKIDHAMAEGYHDSDPIQRVVFGWVNKDGTYRLKFPNDNSEGTYIVRFVADGKEHFRTVDFNIPETLRISETVPGAEGGDEVLP